MDTEKEKQGLLEFGSVGEQAEIQAAVWEAEFKEIVRRNKAVNRQIWRTYGRKNRQKGA